MQMLERTAACEVSGAVAVTDRYDRLAQTLHWIFASIIIYASVTGYALEWIEDHSWHEALIRFNASLTTLLLPLFPLRLAWKYIRVDPTDPAGVGKKCLKLAYTVHDLLYLMIFSVLVTGVLMIPHGYMFFSLFWVPTPFEKGAMTNLFANIHSFCTTFLSALVLLHITGVIYHTLFKRINILRRML